LARPKANLGHTLPHELLASTLQRTIERFNALTAAPLPTDAPALAALYLALAGCLSQSEACLLSALDALDPRTGGGVAEPKRGYQQVRRAAFALLTNAGVFFETVEPTFAKIVHGGSAWPSQPVETRADRGDGRPLYLFRNTYKKLPGLTDAERRAEHDKRVAKFWAEGGNFDEIITATSGALKNLTPGLRYDYVMLADGTLRLHPNLKEQGAPGHSLLATGGPTYKDELLLSAGELWIYKDTAGDLEALVLASNSGHFKPKLADLKNALPVIEKLGVPQNKVVRFGGPNCIPAILTEIEKNCRLDNLVAQLPDDADTSLKALENRHPIRTALALRARR